MKYALAILAVSATLVGCSTTVQTTSGGEYLSQYKYVPVTPSTTVTYSSDKEKPATIKTEEIKSIDQIVRDIAAVEPVLKFPARIGLARIERGSLTMIPLAEAEAWNKTYEKLGTSFGEFSPVNPMIATMVASTISRQNYSASVNTVIDVIRIAAARQHLDAVLIYELMTHENKRDTVLSAANLSIIGGYILPSKLHDVEGIGNAILIDVIQGYPYGTINTAVEKHRASSSWGWGSDDGDRTAFADKIKAQATTQLADEAYALFTKLRAELEAKKKSN